MHNPAPWLLPFASRATTGPFRHAAVKCARFLGRAIGLAAWLLRGPCLNLSTPPPGLSTCCHREIAFRFDLAQRRSIILDPILFPLPKRSNSALLHMRRVLPADGQQFIILKRVGTVPLMGGCTACGLKFFTPSQLLGDAAGAEHYLRDKFHYHECL